MSNVSPYVVEWARLLLAGEYFLSHETLEEHWVDAPEEDRQFLQGLINLTVGMLHHTKGNAKGAALQFAKAARRIEEYPDAYLGVDVTKAKQFLAGDKEAPPDLLLPVG